MTFKTNNGFTPLQVKVSLGGGATVFASDFSFDGILKQYTAEFAVGTGNYPNTTIEVDVNKPADSGGNPAQEDSLSVTGITVNKQ